MAKKQSPKKDSEDLRELIVVLSAEAAPSSTRGFASGSLNKILEKHGAEMTSVFGPATRLFSPSGNSSSEDYEAIAEMASYYIVTDAPDKDALLKDLNKDPQVAGAYIKPAPEPPVFNDSPDDSSPEEKDLPPVTPDFTPRQIYLGAAPGGINALYAHGLSGGKGNGIRIIDIEGAWRFSHEDLIANQGGVIAGTQSTDIGWRNHGTAVVGEFGGDENGKGIVGICPNANVRAISIFGAGMGSANAIRKAADALSAGDIILIELHRPGPRFNFASRADQKGYIAIEWWPDDLAAVKYATAKGVIVVEAAGNGAENLDDAIYNTKPSGFPATWKNPFKTTNPQSGAIIVGAGAPPPGTHGRNHGNDRSRLDFSNYGSRVDVQGWGREVTTCGYGDLQGGPNEDFWYTDTFSGTSSASPIVVGALGSIQGRLKNRGKVLLTPATAKNVLRTTGSPQQDTPGRPATQRIGNRPDLKAVFTKLGVGKFIIKEIKEKDFKEIKERKDHKEKEIKEFKEKDIKERKDLKEKDVKEIKELEKHIKEKDKDLVEGHKQIEVINERINPTDAGDDYTQERLSQLEETVAQLQHYIGEAQRPDLMNPLFSDGSES